MMYPLIAFALAAAPALLLVRYYYRQDRSRPEPKGLVLRVFVFGVLSAFLAIPLELLVDVFQGLFRAHPILYAAFKAFAVAALVEEYLKLTVVRLSAYRSPYFDEVMDGVVYTVVASLGFACMENILYVMGGTLFTALARAFTAVPLHATASGLMGYYVGRSKFALDPGAERRLQNQGLRIAILIHGTYNFLLFMGPQWGPVSTLGIVPLMVMAFLLLRRRIRAATAEDRAAGRTALDAG
ncbi:MAG: PrsW family intramembrane metalloprotease [Spirochaetales bacterium]|nr:PrsW family intramembrane metalloprotease [Spirochaetales bacterium]